MGNNVILFWGNLYARRFWYQLNNALRYFYLKNSPSPVPVFVIGCHRCGSSLLLSYLSVLPDVKVRGEILNPWLYMGIRRNCSNKSRVIRHIRYSLYSADASICVAKLLNVHLERYNILVKNLHKEFPSAKFIVIYRKKLGGQYYSLVNARLTQQWFQKNKSLQDKKKIYIDGEEFNKYCQTIEMFYENLIMQLEKNDKIIVAYEELKEKGQSIIDNKISPFLGVHSAIIDTKLKKQNVKPLSDVVENYQDIKHLLQRKIEL